jgi:hypothetical protein
VECGKPLRVGLPGCGHFLQIHGFWAFPEPWLWRVAKTFLLSDRNHRALLRSLCNGPRGSIATNYKRLNKHMAATARTVGRDPRTLTGFLTSGCGTARTDATGWFPAWLRVAEASVGLSFVTLTRLITGLQPETIVPPRPAPDPCHRLESHFPVSVSDEVADSTTAVLRACARIGYQARERHPSR